LWNETGSLELSVEVSDIVPAGVAYSPKGRWPKREPQSFNINVLNDGRKSDIGDSSSVHGVEVSIEAVSAGS
jgi:anaerobic selenocysteine-containing dehydrogenase